MKNYDKKGHDEKMIFEQINSGIGNRTSCCGGTSIGGPSGGRFLVKAEDRHIGTTIATKAALGIEVGNSPSIAKWLL